MRKLKLQVQISLDGFIAGNNGELDWMEFNWDNELKSYIEKLTKPVDCIVLGRKLAEGFIPHWANIAAEHEHPEHEAGKKFTDTHKVVFSKSLNHTVPAAYGWENTVMANGYLIDEIKKLKEQDGGDIIVYGGAGFVSSLIKAGLIDEYHLLVNPSAIGNGLPIFREIEESLKLKLVESHAYSCGIIILKYVPDVSHTD
ncbi:dihydrofolate reductase family protein [Saccharicrinis sp. FJH2]|uniref:dihydrofolate reductase family protein n=1 Tax=Saccharicrinis sp. FJH65 TaxID=3344659 RepID=UPI0035F260FA